MFRAIAAWLIVGLSGAMILPKALGQMINYPLFYAPLVIVWLASFMVAASVTRDAVKQKKRPTR